MKRTVSWLRAAGEERLARRALVSQRWVMTEGQVLAQRQRGGTPGEGRAGAGDMVAPAGAGYLQQSPGRHIPSALKSLKPKVVFGSSPVM